MKAEIYKEFEKQFKEFRRTFEKQFKEFRRTFETLHIPIHSELTEQIEEFRRTFETLQNKLIEQTEASRSIEQMLIDGRTKTPDTEMVETYDLKQVLVLLDKMDPREATVLRMRFGLNDEDPKTFKEIGECLSLTRLRVRQIENEALAKLMESLAKPEVQAQTVAREAVRTIEAMSAPFAFERIEGEVIDVTDSEVVIRFDRGETDQDVFDECYDLKKFGDQTPKRGERYRFVIDIQKLSPAEPESIPDVQSQPRRNVITGDYRF